MTRDISYIIKRILIGVGIALLLMLIKSNFLCLPVYARTTIQSGVAVGIPNDTTLENYDNKYYTNIYYNPELSYRDITAINYGLIYYSGGSFSHSSTFNDINESINLQYRSMGASIAYFKIALGGSGGYNSLEFDTQYSIALKFTKDSNLAWYGLPMTRSLYRFNIYDLDNHTLLDSDTYVKIDSVGFHTYEENNNQNNGVFIVSFHLDSNDYPYSSDHLALDTFVYSSYGYDQSYSPVWPNANSNFIASIITNMNTNSQTTKPFINKQLYFVKGSILPYGAYCTDTIDHVGCGITGDNPFPDSSGMDIIHDTDIEIMDELPTCDSLDIPCHINRVVKSIQDLFIRFGNFFREFINNLYKTITDLFVPSNDYLIAYFNDTISLIRQKLGFLQYPIELLVSLLNRFNNLTKQTTITYAGFNYPGTNHQIIPAFTFNFDTITNDNSYIAQLYTYYFYIMNGFLCLCFIRLCHKKLISLGLGG